MSEVELTFTILKNPQLGSILFNYGEELVQRGPNKAGSRRGVKLPRPPPAALFCTRQKVLSE